MLIAAIELSVAKIGSLIQVELVFEKVALGGIKVKLRVEGSLVNRSTLTPIHSTFALITFNLKFISFT